MIKYTDGRIHNFIWFLKRPYLYPELTRRIGRNIKSLLIPSFKTHTAEARFKALQEATSWCEETAIEVKEAIYRITGWDQYEGFYEKFNQQLAASAEAVKDSPYQAMGGGNLELIYQLTEYIKAEKVIETGIAFGWSSLAFLLSLKNRNNSLLVSNDLPPLTSNSESYVGGVVPLALKSYWKVIMSPDREALPQALKFCPTIDMCHYDSDKFYEGKLWAYPKLWAALRRGGIFIADDVEDDFAFRDFCNSIKLNPLIVRTPQSSGIFKYVGILIKP
jgi:predicted O-methyltransferase YrrM